MWSLVDFKYFWDKHKSFTFRSTWLVLICESANTTSGFGQTARTFQLLEHGEFELATKRSISSKVVLRMRVHSWYLSISTWQVLLDNKNVCHFMSLRMWCGLFDELFVLFVWVSVLCSGYILPLPSRHRSDVLSIFALPEVWRTRRLVSHRRRALGFPQLGKVSTLPCENHRNVVWTCEQVTRSHSSRCRKWDWSRVLREIYDTFIETRESISVEGEYRYGEE